MALRIFPISCMSVEDNRAHCLGKIVFLKQFFIPDYRGLSDQGDGIDIDGIDMAVFTALALYHGVPMRKFAKSYIHGGGPHHALLVNLNSDSPH